MVIGVVCRLPGDLPKLRHGIPENWRACLARFEGRSFKGVFDSHFFESVLVEQLKIVVGKLELDFFAVGIGIGGGNLLYGVFCGLLLLIALPLSTGTSYFEVDVFFGKRRCTAIIATSFFGCGMC